MILHTRLAPTRYRRYHPWMYASTWRIQFPKVSKETPEIVQYLTTRDIRDSKNKVWGGGGKGINRKTLVITLNKKTYQRTEPH